MGRTRELFEQGLEFVKRGGTIDMTAGLTREELEETADQILSYLMQDSEGLNLSLIHILNKGGHVNRGEQYSLKN